MAQVPNNVKENLKERLGSDLRLPIKGSFEPISGLDLLLQDIQQLLLTLPGERVGRPDWGCNLRALVWENIETAEEDGKASIREALENHEPRIELLGVTSEANENTGLITFNIQFIVKAIDTPVNLVFPFRSGTSLSFS